ncbi:SHOCT domain-containing protein [Agromyces aerolatus]|uniref:SHOCT domain-containing protein n=1 Tax=Agromyces sp. LY-1074 TaxID=3074080 RepID=UPI002860D2C4|nr:MULTISPECIES: SHOCT domain-containing protein [unclassified Agromyces]MDR5701091.1 SHOCT domain-containing protein [Agromyces sp. LY-1074]MDR5707731.1 SHOCT domain-containing protein [Agromyces sp. LY-1358]
MPFVRRVGRPGLIGMAARTAVVAGTATAVSGSVARHQQRKAEEQYQDQYAAQQAQAEQAQAEQAQAEQAATQQAPPSAGGTDIVAELQKLAALKDQGVLSDAEFTAAKAKLIG